MALIHCNFFSETLEIDSSMNVIIPQPQFYGENREGTGIKDTTCDKDNGYPVLYLLHGLSDDHTAWQRRTSIERYVDSLNLVVVMPAVNRSFYTDMVYGQKYWTFISEELPFIVKNLFPISNRREDTYVAGLSMGGYGAFKLALSYPNRFAAAASLSGAVDIAARITEWSYDAKLILGDNLDIAGTEKDLFYLVDKVAQIQGPKPRLYQCCGTEDFLYKDNIKFRDYCKKLPIDFTYEEESGTHEWGYWDRKIQCVLKWIFN